MNDTTRLTVRTCLAATLTLALPAWAQVAPPSQYPNFPSETPGKFVTATEGFDYVKRTAMIPMRDGTKLFTVIVVPKGAKALPS